MSIDTYGLTSEQYTEFFHKNLRFAAKLYLDTCNILSSEGVGNVDFKTVSDMYQEAVYTTNDDCRRYQKSNNPEALKETDVYGMVPSHQEIMDMIETLVTYTEALDAKLEAMYQEAVYTTNDDCRRYQKSNNPDVLKEVTADLYGISPSREELMDEIQSLSAKVESLVDYIGNLVTITTAGLEGIATTLDDKVD